MIDHLRFDTDDEAAPATSDEPGSSQVISGAMRMVVSRSRSSGTTWSFHRPLSVYVNTLSELGFKLERLDELPDPNVDENMKKETLEIPLFAALKARRIP